MKTSPEMIRNVKVVLCCRFIAFDQNFRKLWKSLMEK